MGELSSNEKIQESSSADRLDSWKEIAAHLNRDVTTAQRWEKREGMPVHRHLHDKRGSVYAFEFELDAWMKGRRAQLGDQADEIDSNRLLEPESEEDARAGWRSSRWLIAGSAALLFLIAVSYLLMRGQAESPAKAKISSVAVLPLKNLSGDPAQEYFADGMTEAVIGRLCVIRGLRVISRTSVMRYKDTKASVPEIARALNVDALVEGSVIRDGGSVRVTIQLIRGATDDHFWSQTYDREMKDVLSLQSDLAQAIAQRVEVTVTGEEQGRIIASRSVAPEVYESYLKGQFGKHNTRNEIEQNIAYFQDAIQKDATFAPAYVGLATAYNDLGTVFIGEPPGDVRPKVITSARKALELDPTSADAQVLLADMQQLEWRWADAETGYRRALELKPNDTAVQYGLSQWLLCQGRTDDALNYARRARELDPVGSVGLQEGWILFVGRRYDEAVRQLRSVLALHPDDAAAHWTMGFVLVANGKPNEAVSELEKARTLSGGSPAVIGVLIRAYAHAGNRAEALRLLDELKRRRQYGYVPAGAFVNAYLGLDDREQAFIWLEQAFKERSNILQFLKVHPFFDPVRDEPRFRDLLHRVGLDA